MAKVLYLNESQLHSGLTPSTVESKSNCMWYSCQYFKVVWSNRTEIVTKKNREKFFQFRIFWISFIKIHESRNSIKETSPAKTIHGKVSLNLLMDPSRIYCRSMRVLHISKEITKQFTYHIPSKTWTTLIAY